MANQIVAGNSSNGGTAISTDTSGTLNIVTGSGSGSNAITIDASQVVTIPGNLTVSGTLSASGGVSGGIRSGTAVTASGTSVDFTSLPTGIKRITVIFSGISTNGTSSPLVQLGTSGGVVASGYGGSSSLIASTVTTQNFTTGFGERSQDGAAVRTGSWTITNVSGNIWVCSGVLGRSDSALTTVTGGTVTLSGTLDRLRLTTLNGTDSYDAGTINIFYE